MKTLALAALMAGGVMSAQPVAHAAAMPRGPLPALVTQHGGGGSWGGTWSGGNRNGNGNGNITVANSPSFVNGVQNVVVSANVRSQTQVAKCRRPHGPCTIFQKIRGRGR
ncbi:hypothetical protein ACQP2K_37790 [Microbispora siamensis]